VDWADLVTLDLGRFDQPGGKQELAAQLFDAVNRIGKHQIRLSFVQRAIRIIHIPPMTQVLTCR
jgi:hypothetical protein